MFGLYALSGRVTAFLGPALVGTIASATGSQRMAMGSVLAFFALGGLLLITVPSDAPGPRGRSGAGSRRGPGED